MNPELLDSAAQVLAHFVAGGIFVNQIDEIHIDAQYLLRGLRRGSARSLSPTDLGTRDKRIAIMVPAWKESDVIEQMLEHNLASLHYDRSLYDIFCGTYPNDPETQERVDAVARRVGNVHKIVVPHDGPTCKADCLNHVYKGIIEEERRSSRRFEIILMHDAEDVIHPSSLGLYAHLIPRYEFVQTPVFSLPVPLRQFVAGTYIDEFAEHHLKDMLVREAIGGLVPSAGVGSAFARDAFAAIAAAHGDRPFNIDSLTEDYEIGLKFRLDRRRVHFACYTLPADQAIRREYIATRAYFPTGFASSIRQRSRWILGISLQTWSQLGWRGAPPVLYCLWRDRKALLTNSLTFLGYLLVVFTVLRTSMGALTHHPWGPGRLVGSHPIVAWLLAFNLFAMIWRASMKAHFVGRLNGPWHAVLSAPRLVLGNVISISATARAVTQYVRHRLSGEPLRWLKTSHSFLATRVLRANARRLGELLVETGALAVHELQEVIALQRNVSMRLGELLVLSGMVSGGAVVEAVARQNGLRVADVEPARIPLWLLHAFAEAEAESLGVLPIAVEEGRVVLAAPGPLQQGAMARLESVFGAPVVAALADPAAIARARARAYRRLIPVLDHKPVRTSRPEQSPKSRPVAADDADVTAIARLGIGFCNLYLAVPLARDGDSTMRVVASEAPLHPSVRTAIEVRLRQQVDVVLAPALVLRLALALASTSPGLKGGTESAEIAALYVEAQMDVDLVGAVEEARAAGRSPIDHLESTGRIDAATAARARSRTLGLPITAEPEEAAAIGVLPVTLAAAHGIRLRSIEKGSLVLAAPRPHRRIAREVASIFPNTTIAWEVLLATEEQNDDIQSMEIFSD